MFGIPFTLKPYQKIYAVRTTRIVIYLAEMKSGWLSRLAQKRKLKFPLLGSEVLRTHALQAIPFWIASFITGLVAVGYTKMFVFSENFLQRILHWHSWFIFLVAPVCFFLAWLTIQDGRH